MSQTKAPTLAKIAVLPGDGIGEEVMSNALLVLKKIEELFGHTFKTTKALVGGAAFDEHKNHFPDSTKRICQESDAILFGSVGGPVELQHLEKWKNCEANSLLSIRKTFRFNANFRPAKVYSSLRSVCPLKDEIIEKGIDILILRELLGDIYFGEHSTSIQAGKRVARDIAEYTEDQITSIAHHAFKAASLRRKKVTSIDKANVLDCGKLWREVVREVGKNYPAITLENMLVDNCAMQLIRRPSEFDVVLCPNMFGDILSDEAAVIPGSLGLTPSASLNDDGFGFYEPSGGSAPDIAGKGIANPIAQILSVAMMLRFSFSLDSEARAIERAVEKTLEDGFRTQDISRSGDTLVGTTEITNAILERILI